VRGVAMPTCQDKAHQPRVTERESLTIQPDANNPCVCVCVCVCRVCVCVRVCSSLSLSLSLSLCVCTDGGHIVRGVLHHDVDAARFPAQQMGA
jgi:hypothetical protein